MTPTFAERIVLVHRALAGARIRHGFGGAVALAYYVEEPRATRDIDLNITAGVERAGTVLDALPPGIDIPPEAVERVQRDGQVRLWWDGPAGIPVDLFFPQHELHDEVDRDIGHVPFLDTTIPIISATHLAVFKGLFNRSRDWPDIEAMLRADSVDVAAALDWIARLVGTDSAPYVRFRAVASEVENSSYGGHGSADQAEVDWRDLGR